MASSDYKTDCNLKLKLNFNEEWLDAHPLARADLEREQRRVKPIGMKLTGFESE